jgi:hypothetical protein
MNLAQFTAGRKVQYSPWKCCIHALQSGNTLLVLRVVFNQ